MLEVVEFILKWIPGYRVKGYYRRVVTEVRITPKKSAIVKAKKSAPKAKKSVVIATPTQVKGKKSIQSLWDNYIKGERKKRAKIEKKSVRRLTYNEFKKGGFKI